MGRELATGTATATRIAAGAVPSSRYARPCRWLPASLRQ